MDLISWFHIAVRWAHFISASAWIGGGIFWLVVLRPAVKNDKSDDSRINKNVSSEFRSLVDTCLFVLLATGAVMTFDRLTPGTLGVSYLIVLGVKLSMVAVMFYMVRAKRQTAWDYKSLRNIRKNPKGSIFRVIAGYNLIIVLGLSVYLLSSLLRSMYEITVG
ncbi:MAG: hypothetical protein EGP08_00965 [SAR202 cluster bacterium]|nr:MAG: hypothetical protein EGP08_00965 [SAR202 cluster bacterium]MCH2319317.1 hypothetical protein [SAR202 cluster bacterium]MED5428911.1 hypothetical protein [Chloroflexota bacterium]